MSHRVSLGVVQRRMEESQSSFWGNATEALTSLSSSGLLDPALYSADISEAVFTTEWSGAITTNISFLRHAPPGCLHPLYC